MKTDGFFFPPIKKTLYVLIAQRTQVFEDKLQNILLHESLPIWRHPYYIFFILAHKTIILITQTHPGEQSSHWLSRYSEVEFENVPTGQG